MISLDSETLGLDHFHGSQPFYVTTYDDDPNLKPDERIKYWEWEVDPLTRKPIIPKDDIQDLTNIIMGGEFTNEYIIGQNLKFDVHALTTIIPSLEWPWHRTYDTLIAGHLFASNQSHNLTALALMYCDIPIESEENALKEACTEARRIAKKQFPTWRIAQEGLSEMPSCKADSKRGDRGDMNEKPWCFDMWLPKAIAKRLKYPKDHPWWTVLSEYSNSDSEVTMYVWKTQEKLLLEQGLWENYLLAMKAVRPTYLIERGGITGSYSRLNTVHTRLQEEMEVSNRVCVALSDNKIESLPAGVTNELRDVIYDHFKLESPKKTKKGNDSMDQYVLEYWEATLPPNTPAQSFIRNMRSYRKRIKSCESIESYRKFMLPYLNNEEMHEQRLEDPQHAIEFADFWVLHCSLNGTGTDTTRYSCTNPNLQQISRKEDVNLREAFGPAPNREWWSLDAKNIEKRIPAYESGEETLIELFERPNDPPFYGSEYMMSFSIIYPDIWEKAVKEVGEEKAGPYCKKKYESTWYKFCKTGILAMGYQAGERTADASFHKSGCYKLLKRNQPRLEAHNKWCVDFANEHGYIETIPDKSINSKRGYPLLCARNEYGRISPTIPLAYRTQGTAGQWMKKAMIRVQTKLDEWNRERVLNSCDARIALTVHDELVFDFPKYGDPVVEAAKIKANNGRATFRTSNLWRIREIQRLMELGGQDICVPTPVNVEYHPVSWSEGITL